MKTLHLYIYRHLANSTTIKLAKCCQLVFLWLPKELMYLLSLAIAPGPILCVSHVTPVLNYHQQIVSWSFLNEVLLLLIWRAIQVLPSDKQLQRQRLVSLLSMFYAHGLNNRK